MGLWQARADAGRGPKRPQTPGRYIQARRLTASRTTWLLTRRPCAAGTPFQKEREEMREKCGFSVRREDYQPRCGPTRVPTDSCSWLTPPGSMVGRTMAATMGAILSLLTDCLPAPRRVGLSCSKNRAPWCCAPTRFAGQRDLADIAVGGKDAASAGLTMAYQCCSGEDTPSDVLPADVMKDGDGNVALSSGSPRMKPTRLPIRSQWKIPVVGDQHGAWGF